MAAELGYSNSFTMSRVRGMIILFDENIIRHMAQVKLMAGVCLQEDARIPVKLYSLITGYAGTMTVNSANYGLIGGVSGGLGVALQLHKMF